MMFDIEKACEVTKEILKKHFAKLGTLLHHELLQKVTQRMFAAGLVSQAVNNSPDYNNLMGEYFVVLELCNDHSKFMEYCRTFVRILCDQGGPLKVISEVITGDWNKEIKEQLHVNLDFT